MSYERIDVKPLAGALGAELFGVDLSQKLDAQALAEIRRAFNEHLVIFFRDQDITDEQLIQFGRLFGELSQAPAHRQSSAASAELLIVEKKPTDKLVFGWEWHSDTTNLETPPLGSILYAKIVPPVGGDTLFANQYMAYETLSEGMKHMLSGLRAVHTNGRILTTLAANEVLPPGAGHEGNNATKVATHPVVRTHPDTGRRALFVNQLSTQRFENMTIAESFPILQYLYGHSTRPEFTCRFRWQAGSIAFWDNRCCQHLALDDYPGQRRVMHRVQIKGTRPV